MSNKHTLRFFVVLLFAAFASAALVLADASATGQNANSSTTEESAQNDNANMTPRPRRGRRGRRRAPAQVTNEMAVIAPVAGQDDDSRGDLSGEQVDLSGTYTGPVKTTGGHDMSGEATLTITGNTFTLTGEGMNHNGRVYAVLTRGEVSAAFYFADISVGTPPTPLVFNVRARKRGDSLSLWPAPYTTNKMWFGRGRGRR
ncbi:MAG: hypothetical protein JOZ96_08165 [Acidobacteria bacterium]|nr:hypothetical protein [Acidobacteriota bacterium]